MSTSLALMGLDGEPILTLAAWPLLLGMFLILPGTAAAVAQAVRGLARRQSRRLSGTHRPESGRRRDAAVSPMSPMARPHRAAFFF